MPEISSNDQSFFQLMKEDREQEQYGVQLLLNEPKFKEDLGNLIEFGLFEPVRNPGPEEGQTQGYFRVPYWPVLDYLKAAARAAGNSGDDELAQLALSVVRNVTRNGGPELRDNHHTCRAFAEVLCSVPTSAVSMDDVDLFPDWLGGRFDGGSVVHVLANGGIQRFLGSDAEADWQKACQMVFHCTALEPARDGAGTGKLQPVVDEFWIKELTSKTATPLGAKVGAAASSMFLQRLRSAYANEIGSTVSWIVRAAVEEHPQNHQWEVAYNVFVDALRDALLAWLEEQPDTAAEFVKSMIVDPAQMVNRVAVFLIDRRFESLRGLVPLVLRPHFLRPEYLHETYNLLKNHFAQLEAPEQQMILEAIEELPPSPISTDPELHRQHDQVRWLSAIYGQGSARADALAEQLGLPSTLPAHPDLHSYMEMRVGFGDSPYSPEELAAFAANGTLIERLDNFEPGDEWDGPTVRALSDALVQAVSDEPWVYLNILESFLTAKPAYQYAVLAGLKRSWDNSTGSDASLDWNLAWSRIVSFLRDLLLSEPFWQALASDKTSEPDLTPSRSWIVALAADLLRAGTRRDEHAYPPELLEEAWPIVVALIERADSLDQPSDSDAMTAAINSPKGKAVETLIEHALRVCRVADASRHGHHEEWQAVEPVFNAEILKCKDHNFEFSTLIAAYIGNMIYISGEWVAANVRLIFPRAYTANMKAAISGLAFAPALARIDELLTEAAVFEWAFENEIGNKHARENLIQRIAISYIWGSERLASPRVRYLFENNRSEDLDIVIGYFWNVRGEQLDAKQKVRVLQFWNRCLTWARGLSEAPTSTLANLSRLSSYIQKLDTFTERLLTEVAPYVSTDFNATQFVENLNRLAEESPGRVSRILGRTLDTYQPVFDYEGQLAGLLRKLLENSDTRLEALRHVNRVRLPEMAALYREFTST